jgi:hypothetical protein
VENNVIIAYVLKKKIDQAGIKVNAVDVEKNVKNAFAIEHINVAYDFIINNTNQQISY